jgi:phosphomevalonate kinase
VLSIRTVGIILADPDWHPGPANPDPDPKLFLQNVLSYTFSKKTSKYCPKNIENFDTYDAFEKDKTMLTDTAGNCLPQTSDVPEHGFG